MLKVSAANTKLKGLVKTKYLAKNYLSDKKKVYSLDLLSGFSCPFAKQCLSKVHIIDNRRKVIDGPDTEFRCFSASQEAIYENTYNARKFNYDELKKYRNNTWAMVGIIASSLPKNAGIVRIHVAGDFFNEEYFKAWIKVAKMKPDVLFYAYTKSLRYWVKNRTDIDSLSNFILTASYGGRDDHLIEKHNLRFAKVVFSIKEASDLGLDIDSNDSLAANPQVKDESFALLIHGVQPKGSEAGKAVKKLKGKGSYGKGKK